MPGGGTGIGKAISEELLSLGASVVIASRDEDKVRAAAGDMARLGSVEAARCNIRREEEVSSSRAQTLFQITLVLQTIHRFHNHGEGPYYGLLLVESAYYCFHI